MVGNGEGEIRGSKTTECFEEHYREYVSDRRVHWKPVILYRKKWQYWAWLWTECGERKRESGMKPRLWACRTEKKEMSLTDMIKVEGKEGLDGKTSLV